MKSRITNYLALAAYSLFAIAFAFSCSGEDGGDTFYGCIKGTCNAGGGGILQNSNMPFVNSPIPAGTSPYISDVRFNGSALAGGSSSLSVTSSQPLSELYLQFWSESGHYVLEISEGDLSSSGEGGYVYTIPLLLSQQLQGGELSFAVSGRTGWEDETVVSAVAGGTAELIRPGIGALQVTLSWDKYDDLDLYVTTPSEVTLYYGKKKAPATAKAGKGELDYDSNPGCSLDRRNFENVFFEAPLENGEYSVRVCLYSYPKMQPKAYSKARNPNAISAKAKGWRYSPAKAAKTTSCSA